MGWHFQTAACWKVNALQPFLRKRQKQYAGIFAPPVL
jgi:hypothetical protein